MSEKNKLHLVAVTYAARICQGGGGLDGKREPKTGVWGGAPSGV